MVGLNLYREMLKKNKLQMMVFQSMNEIPPGRLLGDFKRHTSKQLVKVIKDNTLESRSKRCCRL